MADQNEIKKASAGSKLEVVGPRDAASGSQVFRLVRESDKKPTLDLLPGQVLTVGGNDGDITKQEADYLLANNRWEFKTK